MCGVVCRDTRWYWRQVMIVSPLVIRMPEKDPFDRLIMDVMKRWKSRILSAARSRSILSLSPRAQSSHSSSNNLISLTSPLQKMRRIDSVVCSAGDPLSRCHRTNHSRLINYVGIFQKFNRISFVWNALRGLCRLMIPSCHMADSWTGSTSNAHPSKRNELTLVRAQCPDADAFNRLRVRFVLRSKREK